MRAVTAGLTESPRAYAQTPGPNGVSEAATARDGRDEEGAMGPRHPVVEILEPGQPEDDRPEEEAAVDVRPDDDQHRDRPEAPRVRVPVDHEQQDDRKDRHPDQLRAQPERDRRDHEGRQGQERRGPRGEPPSPPDREQAAEDDDHERRTQEDETRPAGQLVDGGQDDLGAPLLVGPGAPAAVNVHVSVVGMPPPARMPAPARR